ncbi:O-antigen ligase family protein [Vallicoccus soli]|uniref:O-antigen ligase domain-containing protein n=1 Tax=Vallicoccus soli TaxID=2339232 RepID=A0A3A3Z3A3_9ACTN|nr:hypothetical protein [Vallicoccus soli]RJK97894.1 hypothetical protein D5H78_02685 [Vallicoccus soli]
MTVLQPAPAARAPRGGAERPRAAGPARPGRGSWLERRLGPAWPLKVLLLGFPLWWALGLASFVFLLLAVPMAVQVVRRGPLKVPAGFGVWVLFLAWMLLGVLVLWADAPGTLGGGGPERLLTYGYRVLWYLAITVAMLYPMSLPSWVLPTLDVARWLGALFLVCVLGGLAGIAFPHLEFTSLAELVVPGARQEGWVHSLVHPSLTTYSDFLGYEQPRPKAPFVYPNAWGNNVGLLLPFFVVGWLTAPQRWRRWAVPVVLAAAAAPIAFSLNRGLWLGLGLVVVYTAVQLARSGRLAALWALTVAGLVAAAVLVASPLWSTVTLRIDTPHSNDRRGTVAEVVTTTTLEGSPLLGYGSTRQVDGSFASIAGGKTPDCRQCAAPPLGTQGFMWRLVFTTGFVGTALFLGFLAVQLLRHVRRRTPAAVLGCLALLTSGLFFFVYDSLESPLFVLMLAVGLMNRERLEDEVRRRTGRTRPRVPRPPRRVPPPVRDGATALDAAR